MKKNIRIWITIALIIITAIFIQISRSNIFSKSLIINQIDDNLENVNKKSSKINLPSNIRKFLFLYSLDSEGNKLIYTQAKETFKLAKLNVEFIDIDNENIYKKIKELSYNDELILGTESLYKLKRKDFIINYVKNGGTLVSLIRETNFELNEIYGILKNNNFLNDELIGIKFDKNIFPGLSDIEIKTKLVTHSSLDLTLSNDVEIIATSEGIPIIWSYDYKMGRTVYVNSTMLMDKNNRGVLLQTVLYPLRYSIFNIMNSFILNIDDFPAPIKRGKNSNIFSEYSLNNVKFYKRIWLSDIINLVSREKIKITGLVIGTYNNDTISPIENISESNIHDIQYYGRRLSETSGEIGIHGYNHQSLTLEGEMDHINYGYIPWESQQTMEEALRILKNNIENIYGNIKIYTYVPPSNIISKTGKIAVKNVFKDVVVFAGIYAGETEKGVLYQEFGEDPDIKGVYSFPRFSSGYENSTENLWSIYNAIATFGIFNHFIHPDDILDSHRSHGKDWRELYTEFSSMISNIKKNFPFFRSMTDYEAYRYYRSIENLKVYTKYEDRNIYIYSENMVSSVFYIARIRDDISKIIGGEYKKIDEDLYLIKCNEPIVNIFLEEK